MKKNRFFILGMTALLAFGLVFVSCGGGGNSAASLLKKLNSSSASLEKTLSTVTPEVLAELTSVNGSPGGDFSYGLNKAEDGIQIKKYTGTDAVVIIPSKIEDYPVVGINGNAFTGGYQWEAHPFLRELSSQGVDTSGYEEPTGGAKMTAVVIPSGVTSIWRSAFRNCEKLHTVVLPDTLESIGANAFDGAGELYNLVIPETLTSLRFDEGNDLMAGTKDAFAGCSKLKLATRKRLQELGYKGEF
jgi:hypothetical protein